MTVLAFRRDPRERVWAWQRRIGFGLVVLGTVGHLAALAAYLWR